MIKTVSEYRPQASAGRTYTEGERRLVFWQAFALVVISWISMKIVLPILPGLPAELHGTSSGVKLSVSLYLMFFALSQPFWGALAQKTSGSQAVYYSILITATGSIIAMLSFNLPMYIVGRSMEGFGMGAASSIGRAMLSEVYERKELSHYIGFISGTAATMPAVAPLVGGYMMVWFNWRAIFLLLLFLVSVYFYFLFRRFPQTRSQSLNEQRPTARQLAGIYIANLKSRSYWGYALPYAALMGGLIGYYSAMPFWYHLQLGIAKHHFSFLALPTVALYVFGLVVADFLLKRRELEEVFLLGILLTGFTAVVAISLAYFLPPGAASIVVVMCLLGFSTGLVTPNANAGVLTHFRTSAAPTSALVALSLFGTASITSSVTMNLHIKDSLWPIAGYIGGVALISLLSGYFWMWRPFQRAGREGVTSKPV